jgi:PAS domain-containing protein
VQFPAHTVSTLQRDSQGSPVGLLLISKSVSFETRLSKVKRLLDNKILGNNEEVVDFLGNILESSTEYSMIGKDLEGNIILWNEGARRLYGYEPEEMIGKANSSILHTEDDIQAGKPADLRRAPSREMNLWQKLLSRVNRPLR